MAVRIEIETEPVSGGRVVLHLLFRLLPMLVMAGVLTAAATIVAFAIGISVVATGHVPSIRQRVRTFSGFFLLRADTPAWPAELDLCDPGDDPRVTVTVDVPTTLVRWAPLSHTARAVAHLLLLVPLAVALDLLYPVWLVLVARRGWSTTAKERLVVTEQWTADVLAHAWLVSATPPRPRWAELTSARRSTGSNR